MYSVTHPAAAHSANCCPLCHTQRASHYCRDRKRDYLQCSHCELVFVADNFLLDAVSEKAQYDLHCNAVDDPDYRRFLGKLAQPLMQYISSPAQGLDFGCGPGPALAAMLHEQGHSVALYDPFYFPDTTALAQTYDFVTCTEVIEHAHDAAATWATLFSLLRPGGWLGIMTKRVINRDAFSRWHYKNDPTHVRFYSDHTLQWITKKFQVSLQLASSDVALFQKTTFPRDSFY